VNPWSEAWWRGLVTGIIVSVVASLLVLVIRDALPLVWRKWIQYPVVVFFTKWTSTTADTGLGHMPLVQMAVEFARLVTTLVNGHARKDSIPRG
jgi:hypothetical protein